MLTRLAKAWAIWRNADDLLDAADNMAATHRKMNEAYRGYADAHFKQMREVLAVVDAYKAENRDLQQQTEHDALMIQAYANWCEAHGCTPTRDDLQRASGKKA
jgi:hypothetical protein